MCSAGHVCLTLLMRPFLYFLSVILLLLHSFAVDCNFLLKNEGITKKKSNFFFCISDIFLLDRDNTICFLLFFIFEMCNKIKHGKAIHLKHMYKFLCVYIR